MNPSLDCINRFLVELEPILNQQFPEQTANKFNLLMQAANLKNYVLAMGPNPNKE